MVRDPNERVGLMLRIPEWIRAVLEAIGKESGQSLNTTIVQILKERIEEPATGLPNRLFARPDINNIFAGLYFIIIQAEEKTGKHWLDDTETFNVAVSGLVKAFAIIDPISGVFEREPYHGSGLSLGHRVTLEMIRDEGEAAQ